MIFPDTPEARRKIDRRLDPDNLIEEDSCRTQGDLLDLTRIMIRSIRVMTPEEKQLVRDALNQKIGFTHGDLKFLWSIGSNI